MEVVDACITTICLSGLEGCSLAELWRHLPACCSMELVLDEAYKTFLWSQLLGSAIRAVPPSVALFRTPRPRLPLPQEGTVYVYPHGHVEVDENGVRGSCIDFKEREDVTATVLAEKLTLEQVQTRYGDHLVIVGGPEQRERALCPPGVDPLKISQLSIKQYVVLELVGACRRHGVSRIFLTSFTKSDPRSTFHYTRSLAQNGFITIQPSRLYVHNKLQYSFILYLMRFTDPGTKLTNQFLEHRLSSLFQSAPYQALNFMSVHQLLGIAPRTVNKILRLWVRRGVLEVVPLMADLCEEYAQKHSMNCKGYKMVRPYSPMESNDVELDVEENEEVEEEEEEEEEEEDGDKDAMMTMKEEEEEEEDETERVPVIREVPLTLQSYRYIERLGSEGIDLAHYCCHSFDLHRNHNRLILNNLIKTGLVSTVIIDEGVSRKSRVLATCHLHSSSMYQKLQTEQAGTAAFRLIGAAESPMEMEERGASLDESMDHEPEELRAEKEEEELEVGLDEEPEAEQNSWAESSEGNGGGSEAKRERMDRNKLKHVRKIESVKGGGGFVRSRRLNLILKYVATNQVVTGHVDISKYIKEQDHLEGRGRTLDRKTMKRLLATLIDEHLLCVEQVEHASYAGFTSHSLYFLPNVEQKLLETTKQELLDAVEKVNKKKMKTEDSKRKKDEDEEEEEDEDEVVEGGSGRELERKLATSNIPGQNNRSKYQRLKQLHYYLWVLAHGYSPGDPSPGGNATSMSKSQLVRLFPWLKSVEQVSQHIKGPGWLSNESIVESMPLLLWLLLTGIYSGASLPVFPAKFMSYCCDPEKCLNRLDEVPQKLRKYVAVSKLPELLQKLQVMKLIEIERNPKQNNIMYLYVCEEAQVLDTSVCSERASYFLEEARQFFQSTSFHFQSLSDLEEYWILLQYVCLKTRVIIPHNRKDFHSRLDPRDDQWSLPINVHTDDKQIMELLGFGAGGLPPLMFSHHKKNWQSSRVLRHGTGGGKHDGVATAGASPGKGKKRKRGEESGSAETLQYCPGDDLLAIPISDLGDDSFLEDEDKDTERVVQAEHHDREEMEEVKISQKGLSSKRRKILVPDSQVRAHVGGRGYSRRRVQFEPPVDITESPDKVTKTKDSDRNSAFQSATDFPALKYLGDEEVEKNKEKADKNVIWTAEKDKFLFSCYLTGILLYRLVNKSPQTSFQFVATHFMESFPDHRPCNAHVIKHRMYGIKRRKITPIGANVSKSLVDLQEELEQLGSAAPPLEFQSVFDFIFSKLSSDSVVVPVGSLPNTLDDLYNKYSMTYQDTKSTLPVTLATVTSKSAEVLLLSDLIMSIICNEHTGIDRLKIFKLLERFPQDKLEEAWSYLKDKGLVRSKRSSDFSINPFASSWMRIDFRYLVEAIISQEDFQEKEDFNHTFEILRGGHVLDFRSADEAVNLEENGSLVCGSGCRRGSMAAILDKVALLDRHVVSASSRKPIQEEKTPTVQEGVYSLKSDTSALRQLSLTQNKCTPSQKEGIPAIREETPAFREGTPAFREGTPVFREGTPAFREGTPAFREGTPAFKEGTPAFREGTPAFREETPAIGEGTPAFRDGTPSFREEPSNGSTPIFREETPALGNEIPMETSTIRESILVQDMAMAEQQCDGQEAEEGGRVVANMEVEVSQEEVPDNAEVPDFHSTFAREIDKGSLVLQPSINIATLLGPPPPQSPSISSDTSTDQSRAAVPSVHHDSHTLSHSNRSLVSYLALCKNHLSYTQSECAYVSRLYELIDQAGVDGVEQEQILSSISNGDEVGRDFKEIIISLINFELVYVVGAVREVLISHNYAQQWLCWPPEGGSLMINYSPWMNFSSRDPNETMLNKYLHAVYTFILAHPGVTWDRLVDQLAIILTPCRLKNILLLLECEGRIRRCSLECPTSSPTLFSKSSEGDKTTATSKTTTMTRKLEYFEPVLN